MAAETEWTTPSKNMNLYFTLECRNCKSVQYAYRSKKFAQAKHAVTAFNSKRRYQTLAISVCVLQITYN